jgi:competence protein ComEA
MFLRKLFIFCAAFILSTTCVFAANKNIKTTPAQTATSASARVNINTANETSLANVKGIGAKKAKAIIDYRQKNGEFKSVNDLAKVSGLGDKSVKKIANYLTV